MRNLPCSSLDSQFEWSNNYDVGRKDSPGKHRDCPLRPVSGTKYQAVRKAIEGPRTHSCPLVGLLELRQSPTTHPLVNVLNPAWKVSFNDDLPKVLGFPVNDGSRNR
jgi:hypothetical protein